MMPNKARATRVSNILHDVRITDLERVESLGDRGTSADYKSRAVALLALLDVKPSKIAREKMVQAAAFLVAAIERIDQNEQREV